MTTREMKLCAAILDVLHDLDGGQASEIGLHGEMNQIVPCPLAEFTAALALCDRRGWVTGVTARLNPQLRKWNLNDAGEAARLELRP